MNSESMRSYRLEPGRGLDGLTLQRRTVLSPERGQVLVRIHANALGYRDLLVLANNYPLPIAPGVVPGCEGVGEVVAVGADVTRFAIGDRVAATVFPRWVDGPFRLDAAAQLGTMVDGVLTEYAVLDEQGLVRIPDYLSYQEAAALPLAAVTAWHALTAGAPLRPGQTVLTLGSGAVSLFTVQLAVAAGARVIATTSSEAKAERLRKLGVDEVVDYRRTPDWYTVVREATGGAGADRVIDSAGPLWKSIRAAALGAEIAVIGYWLSGDAGAEPIDPELLFNTGAVLRPIATGSRAHFEALTQVLTYHRLSPVIDRVFTFAQVPDALNYIAAGGGFGKVIISHD
ncbi:NAD(P)-dependent alcohol dehydrogenase [Nocardia sp. SYP-A9097]|uniref:zinc-dependent alcohol dehydrogenase family protein n=1 Tax=Nocardia sp. SYP-A9097 TaxID=2663237 RepID=UPI0028163597|nr:NAD(P)-dependent alcohol dehydrogenase [Nocardia sp. SYP-A9097]